MQNAPYEVKSNTLIDFKKYLSNQTAAASARTAGRRLLHLAGICAVAGGPRSGQNPRVFAGSPIRRILPIADLGKFCPDGAALFFYGFSPLRDTFDLDHDPSAVRHHASGGAGCH